MTEAAKKDYAAIVENCAFDQDTFYVVNKTDFELQEQKCGDGKTGFKVVDGYHLVMPNYLKNFQPGG